MSDSLWPLWTAAGQAPPSMGFSRQEYRNGFHALLQGIFPHPWIKLASPALVGRFFTTNATWKVQYLLHEYNIVSVAQSFIKILIENHFLSIYCVYGTERYKIKKDIPYIQRSYDLMEEIKTYMNISLSTETKYK